MNIGDLIEVKIEYTGQYHTGDYLLIAVLAFLFIRGFCKWLKNTRK